MVFRKPLIIIEATNLFNIGFDEKLIKMCLNIAFLALRKLSDIILLCAV